MPQNPIMGKHGAPNWQHCTCTASHHPQVLSLMVWSAPTSNVTRLSGAMTIGSWNHSSKYWTAMGFGTLQYVMFCSTITCSLYYNGWLVLIGIWGSGGWTGLYVTCPCSWPGPDWGLRYHVVWCTPWETGLRDNCDWCCIHKHWASWSQGMPIQLFVNNPPTHPLICSFVILRLYTPKLKRNSKNTRCSPTSTTSWGNLSVWARSRQLNLVANLKKQCDWIPDESAYILPLVILNQQSTVSSPKPIPSLKKKH